MGANRIEQNPFLCEFRKMLNTFFYQKDGKQWAFLEYSYHFIGWGRFYFKINCLHWDGYGCEMFLRAKTPPLYFLGQSSICKWYFKYFWKLQITFYDIINLHYSLKTYFYAESSFRKNFRTNFMNSIWNPFHNHLYWCDFH